MTTSIQLQADNIHKRFGSNEVLKGVSVTAHKGDVIAMIGSSGSGKSTFLRCLNLLEQPNAGRIVLGGEELALVADKSGTLQAQSAEQLKLLRSQVAMVFQHFNLWAHMTALENVIEAPVHVLKLSKAQALERAQAYLQRVVTRITWAGAFFLGFVAILPFFIGLLTDVRALTVSTTGFLIVVAVVLDTMKQLEAQLLMRNYEGFIR